MFQSSISGTVIALIYLETHIKTGMNPNVVNDETYSRVFRGVYLFEQRKKHLNRDEDDIEVDK